MPQNKESNSNTSFSAACGSKQVAGKRLTSNRTELLLTDTAVAWPLLGAVLLFDCSRWLDLLEGKGDWGPSERLQLLGGKEAVLLPLGIGDFRALARVVF